MELTEEQQAYLDICEKNGWSYSIDEKRNEVELSKNTPAGEDFSFTVPLDDLPDEVYSYLSNFDADEHVETWIQARNAGVGGVPTTRELVDDAEAIERMIEDLSNALYGRSSASIDNTLKKPVEELLAEYQAVMVDICRALGTDPKVDISDPAYRESIFSAIASLREPSLKNAAVLKQHEDTALLFTGDNVEPFIIVDGYDPDSKDWNYGTYYSSLHEAICDYDKEFGNLAYSYTLTHEDLYPILEKKGYEPTPYLAQVLINATDDFSGVSEYINENLMMLFDGEINPNPDMLSKPKHPEVEQQPQRTSEKSFHAHSIEEIKAQQQSHKPQSINPKDDLAMGREAASQSPQDHNLNIGRSR